MSLYTVDQLHTLATLLEEEAVRHYERPEADGGMWVYAFEVKSLAPATPLLVIDEVPSSAAHLAKRAGLSLESVGVALNALGWAYRTTYGQDDEPRKRWSRAQKTTAGAIDVREKPGRTVLL